MVRTTASCLAIAVLLPPLVGAQSPPADNGSLTYDVVSVKPNKSATGGGRIGSQPGGRWLMVNGSTSGLIHWAYPTKVAELVGAPGWVTSERFDVDARATFDATIEQHRAMLRSLLADRFKLAAHYEQQERPIYTMGVARADGRLGPRIRRVDVECPSDKSPTRAQGSPAPPATDPPPCGYRMSGATTLSIMSGGSTMQSIASVVSGQVDRPVFDRTGLAGYYAFTMDSIGENGGVSIFTALQEQLGLKLERARGPVDVVVIDHIERPTEN